MRILLSHVHLDFLENAHCACLVQPTLCATCSHSLVMVAPRSGAFGRRRGNKSCGFIGKIASCVAMRGYFWRNIETCALKMFECERLFVNSTALNLSHVAILMMMISFLKCAFFRTLNFLMYIACSLNSILNAKMHGPCREHNLQRNFTGPVMAPRRQKTRLRAFHSWPRFLKQKNLISTLIYLITQNDL